MRRRPCPAAATGFFLPPAAALDEARRSRWSREHAASRAGPDRDRAIRALLDITIVTVALPTILRELGFQQAELQWLVTSYALAFGGFLLLAGRAADLFGRRRLFVLGILVFGGASLAAGLSLNKLMPVGRAGPGPGRRHRLAGRARALDDDPPRGRNRTLGMFGRSPGPVAPAVCCWEG
jgi:MFS family permease